VHKLFSMEPTKSEVPRLVPVPRMADVFRDALQKHAGEHHAVCIRGYPDPDSIGSAMAHSYIAKRFGIETTILYFDDISHHENRALVKKLAIEMVRYDNTVNLKDFNNIVIVDGQLLETHELDKIQRFAIVDHHKIQAEPKAEFVDIRDDVGATCSLYAEYFMHALAPLIQEDPEASRLATALICGIRADTDDYLLARELDYRALSYLAPLADHDLLISIAKHSISPHTMETTQRAYANKIMADSFLISGVGYIRDEDRDSIGQAADYLLKREGIDTVLCYGIVNNQFIDGSLRTTSDVIDPDRFLKETFGCDNHGVFYGGGRSEKGAFKMPLGPFACCSDKELLWRTVQRTIEDQFFKKIGIERDQTHM